MAEDRKVPDETQEQTAQHYEDLQKAGREYEEATEDLVRSGEMEDKTGERRDMPEAKRKELEEAEAVGKEQAKEEDPEIVRDYSKPTR
ncbi:MAG: hypothetical protein WAN46_11615 [Gammaproteobacteria bacterium]|jgi:uncharacterized protein YciI